MKGPVPKDLKQLIRIIETKHLEGLKHARISNFSVDEVITYVKSAYWIGRIDELDQDDKGPFLNMPRISDK